MKTLTVFAFIMLSACGREPCESDTFRTSGLIICHNNLDVKKGELNLAVRLLEQELNLVYPDISNLVSTFNKHDIEVIFIDDDLSINCEKIDRSGIYVCDHHIGGANVNGVTLYVRYWDCLARTSFAHELLHSVEKFYLDIKDGKKHDTPYFFMDGTDLWEDTIEFKVSSELVQDLDRC